VPILVCGTKLDMAPERGKKSPSTVAAECGVDEILLVNSIQIFSIHNIFLINMFSLLELS